MSALAVPVPSFGGGEAAAAAAAFAKRQLWAGTKLLGNLGLFWAALLDPTALGQAAVAKLLVGKLCPALTQLVRLGHHGDGLAIAYAIARALPQAASEGGIDGGGWWSDALSGAESALLPFLKLLEETSGGSDPVLETLRAKLGLVGC